MAADLRTLTDADCGEPEPVGQRPVRLPLPIYLEVQALARRKHRSLVKQVEHMLRAYLDAAAG